MNAHGSMTTMPVPTGARVRRAWETVSDELRRSTAAAVVTAVLLASALPLAPAAVVLAGVLVAWGLQQAADRVPRSDLLISWPCPM